MDFMTKLFLSQFESRISTEIIEFGKRLSKSKAEVYFLMARKAACFLDCMEALSLVHLDGYVTTERVLDMETSWLKGKNVIIVDDAIVSGTTLHKMVKKLVSIGVSDVRIHALCINDKWYKKELLEKDDGGSFLEEPCLKLSDEECIKACSDIVKALSIIPRPYLVDFPYFGNFKVFQKDLWQILKLSDWESDEVSSILQHENNVFSITLTPNNYALVNYDKKIGYPLSKQSMIKLRLYGRQLSLGKKSSLLKFIPIIALKPTKKEDVEKLFDALIKNLSFPREEFRTCFKSNRSRLRLIQYFAAAQLAQCWVDSISNILKGNWNLKADVKRISFLFSNSIVEVVQEKLLTKLPILKGAPQSIENVTLNTPEEKYGISINGKDLVSLQARLTQPFLNLFFEKELKARDLVFKDGIRAFEKDEYKIILDRLNFGYSFVYLRKLLVDVDDEYNTEKLVSLFLDKSIDAGIVVPITADFNGILFRAYRHGEDVLFGEEEERLCAVMLDSFIKSSGKKEIPHLWLEKLMVLLIKIGVQNNFLEPYITNIPPPESLRLASVKTYLHGPIAIEKYIDDDDDILDKPYLDEDRRATWLTQVLQDREIIEIEKESRLYKLKEMPNITLERKKEGQAENIGTIFGMLLTDHKNSGAESEEKQDQRWLSNQDLISLTACLLPSDIISALAAELNIFYKRWRRFRRTYYREKNNRDRFTDLANRIRKRDNFFFLAINSGEKKFFSFMKKEPHKIIERIGDKLKDVVYRNIWYDFWSPNRAWEIDTVDKDLMKLITIQGLWLLSANVYLRILDYSLREEAKIINEENNKIKAMLLEEVEDYQRKLSPFSSYEKAKSILPLIKKFLKDSRSGILNGKFYRESVIKAIDQLLYNAKQILDDVELTISPLGKIENIIRYSHTAYIEINEDTCKESHSVWFEIQRIIRRYEEKNANYNKTQGRNESLLVIPQEKNILKRGLWIASTGHLANPLIINLAQQICQEISQHTNVRVTVFSQLPEFFRIKISGKSSTDIKFGFFWNAVYNLKRYIQKAKITKTEIITILEDGKNLIDEFGKLNKKVQWNYTLGVISKVKLQEPYPVRYIIKNYTKNIHEDNETARKMDIGIITIVASETRAVREILMNQIKERGKKTGRTYYKGHLMGEKGINHKVVVSSQLEQGNRAAIAAYNDMVKEYDPSLMILFGIAGGISKKCKLCDVVIADQIIYYENRKETKEKTYRRGQMYKIPPKIQVYINDFFVEHGEFARFESSKDSYEKTFAIFQGPIASGEAVIANETSEISKWLKEVNSKVLAVEMEAGGFAHAYYEGELDQRNKRIGNIIIRGISDHADQEKNDKWRIASAQNAAKALKELVKLMPGLV